MSVVEGSSPRNPLVGFKYLNVFLNNLICLQFLLEVDRRVFLNIKYEFYNSYITFSNHVNVHSNQQCRNQIILLIHDIPLNLIF